MTDGKFVFQAKRNVLTEQQLSFGNKDIPDSADSRIPGQKSQLPNPEMKAMIMRLIIHIKNKV